VQNAKLVIVIIDGLLVLRSTFHHISAILMEEIIEPPIVTNKLVASSTLSHELVMIYYRAYQNIILISIGQLIKI